MRYWLMKSEPDVFSIDDLGRTRGKTTAWWGVRNYQARNFMRDQMQLGDQAFFYHSSCPQPGVIGIVQVCTLAYPDATQFDPTGEYYDPAATLRQPRWFNVDVKLVRKTRLLQIQQMRQHPELADMRVLQKGNRLSITPVEARHWKFVVKLLDKPPRN